MPYTTTLNFLSDADSVLLARAVMDFGPLASAFWVVLPAFAEMLVLVDEAAELWAT